LRVDWTFLDYLSRNARDLLAGKFCKQVKKPAGVWDCIVIQKGYEFCMAGGNASVARMTKPDHWAENVLSPKTRGNAACLGRRGAIIDNKHFKPAEYLVVKMFKTLLQKSGPIPSTDYDRTNGRQIVV
jgi:hypothetical protein